MRVRVMLQPGASILVEIKDKVVEARINFISYGVDFVRPLEETDTLVVKNKFPKRGKRILVERDGVKTIATLRWFSCGAITSNGQSTLFKKGKITINCDAVFGDGKECVAITKAKEVNNLINKGMSHANAFAQVHGIVKGKARVFMARHEVLTRRKTGYVK